MQQLKHLAKDTLFYGVGSAAQKFIGLFMFPIYTRLLSKGEFGIQDLMSSTLAIISYVLMLGLDSAASRYYFDSENGHGKKLVISTWLWTILAIAVAATLVLVLTAGALCKLLFNDASLAIYLRLTVANLPLTLFLSIAYLALRLRFKSKTYSFVIVSGILIQALFCIFFVTVLRWGILGVFYGQLFGNVIKTLIAIIVTRDSYSFIFSRPLLRRMLAFGVPIVPASISLWLLNYSNRIFLARYDTLDDIGLLSAAMRIGSIVAFLITAFRTAWAPFAFSVGHSRERSPDTYSRVFSYYSLITSLAVVVLSAFAHEILLLLATSTYRSASALVIYTCLSPVLWGATYIVGIGYQLEKKSYHVTAMTAVGAIVNIGLNFLLIPALSIEGAAIATVAGNFATLLYSYLAGRKYMRLSYNTRSIILLAALMASVVIASRLADAKFPEISVVSISIKMVLVLIFCSSSFFTNRHEWTSLITGLSGLFLRRKARTH